MSDKPVLAKSPTTAGETWSIDAHAPLQAMLDSPECPPLLRQTLSGTLAWQTRNETPIHKALTSHRIAPQWVAALLALGATVTIREGDSSIEVPFETLTQRQAEKKVSSLHIREKGVRWSEAHVARTPADEPIVAAVAAVTLDDGVVRQARVALTGVWSKPASLAKAAAQLVGNPLDAEHIRAVADAVQKQVTPKGDFLGSEEYRRAMAGVLTRRALAGCQRQGAKDE
jgi:CO/xanthine dehydrogenase FAD-binding subunit